MARKGSEIEEILPSEIEERDLLDENEEDDESKHGEAMPKVLRDLSEVLTNMHVVVNAVYGAVDQTNESWRDV